MTRIWVLFLDPWLHCSIKGFRIEFLLDAHVIGLFWLFLLAKTEGCLLHGVMLRILGGLNFEIKYIGNSRQNCVKNGEFSEW